MNTDKGGILKAISNAFSTLLLGDTKERIVRMEKDVEYIRSELDRDIRPVLKKVEERVTILWSSRVATRNSPLILNEQGRNVLKYSGIKEILDTKRIELEQCVKEQQPRNPYRLQEYSKKAVFALKEDPAVLSQLEEGAYQVGEDVDTLLFVGSLYLRNILLEQYPEFQHEKES